MSEDTQIGIHSTIRDAYDFNNEKEAKKKPHNQSQSENDEYRKSLLRAHNSAVADEITKLLAIDDMKSTFIPVLEESVLVISDKVEEIVESSKSGTTAPYLCDHCENKEAKFYCLHCREDCSRFCEECSTGHRSLKLFRSHKLREFSFENGEYCTVPTECLNVSIPKDYESLLHYSASQKRIYGESSGENTPASDRFGSFY